MRKLLVVVGMSVALVVAFSGTASAANNYSAWGSCQHGFSIDMSGWPKGYTVTITDNGVPFASVSNAGGAKYSHTESAKSALAIVDTTIPHTFVVDVKTAESGKSFTDAIDMPACGAAWPGYAYSTDEP